MVTNSRFVDSYGQPTKPDDVQREMWYSVSCTYWTDDWNKLSKFGPGIPCCPACKSPGYQSNYKKWDDGARSFDSKESGYYNFLQKVKEKCLGMRMNQAYEQYKALRDGKDMIDQAIRDFVGEEK